MSYTQLTEERRIEIYALKKAGVKSNVRLGSFVLTRIIHKFYRALTCPFAFIQKDRQSNADD